MLLRIFSSQKALIEKSPDTEESDFSLAKEKSHSLWRKLFGISLTISVVIAAFFHHARRAALFCPIAVSRSGKKEG
jgi:hypothetical protein